MSATATTARAYESATAVVAPRRRKPRVMFLITTTDFGGTESILLELAKALPAHGLEPVVCSLCAPGRIGREIAAAGVPVTTLDMAARPAALEVPPAAWRVARLIDERRVDVVQTLLYRANTIGALAARLARRRPVLISSQRSLDPRNAPLSSKLVSWTRHLARATVTVSEAVRAEVLANEGVRPDSVLVIRNGVDVTRFAPRDAIAARAALGLGADACVVGAVGRLSAVKGFGVLLDALTLARERGNALELVLAGDGPQRRALERRAAALRLRVSFLGAAADLERFYDALDIFALPSMQEGSPNALLEAMSSARACVATRVGGVPEILEHERSGILVPPNDAESFARALVTLATNPRLRDGVGREARRRILDAFDIRRTVVAHAALYHSVLPGAVA